jgi:hypothetical protein
VNSALCLSGSLSHTGCTGQQVVSGNLIQENADFRIAEKMHPIRRVHGVHHSLLETAPYASPLRIRLREFHCTTDGRDQHLSAKELGL